MINTLISMGFDRTHAELALKSVSYESEQSAIEFLIERDLSTGKYRHPMIEIGNSGLCMICNEIKSEHQD